MTFFRLKKIIFPILVLFFLITTSCTKSSADLADLKILYFDDTDEFYIEAELANLSPEKPEKFLKKVIKNKKHEVYLGLYDDNYTWIDLPTFDTSASVDGDKIHYEAYIKNFSNYLKELNVDISDIGDNYTKSILSFRYALTAETKTYIDDDTYPEISDHIKISLIDYFSTGKTIKERLAEYELEKNKVDTPTASNDYYKTGYYEADKLIADTPNILPFTVVSKIGLWYSSYPQSELEDIIRGATDRAYDKGYNS